jgi:UDPglucose 6-dehydrogenase
MNILIAGCGYVGMGIGSLLLDLNKVTFLDKDEAKTKLIKELRSPIDEIAINERIQKYSKNINTTNTIPRDLDGYDFIFVCLPTNYDIHKNWFDTSIINDFVKQVRLLSNVPIVIKSTIPIGYTKQLDVQFGNIIFSPEFLREGRSLEDNLHPSRLIISSEHMLHGKALKNLLSKSIQSKEFKYFFTKSSEAESIKLIANTYLATRISFFNEIDSYCLDNNLDSKEIIDGVCSDPRIGNLYNNPSFGYGGYCLPKDTKQLSANFENISHPVIQGSIQSNSHRTNFLSDYIINKGYQNIGFYNISMKAGSDNFRESASLKLIEILFKKGCKIFIFDNQFKDIKIDKIEVTICQNIEELNNNVDIIMANRMSSELDKLKDKVFTRDIYGID